MRLAKPHLDVGLFTDREPEMLAFWQKGAGLEFEETLPLGGGVRQHRHAMNGAVFKLNAARDPLPVATPSGYRRLLIAREGIMSPGDLIDPDGNRATLVPPGYQGIVGVRIDMAVQEEAAFHRFFGEAMQFEHAGGNAYLCGDSIVTFAHDASAVRTDALRAPGYRYLTVQVWDVDAEHAGIVARGGAEGRSPVTLGTTARVSFVRDPDGNWIEVSQRASLTGALEPAGRS